MIQCSLLLHWTVQLSFFLETDTPHIQIINMFESKPNLESPKIIYFGANIWKDIQYYYVIFRKSPLTYSIPSSLHNNGRHEVFIFMRRGHGFKKKDWEAQLYTTPKLWSPTSSGSLMKPSDPFTILLFNQLSVPFFFNGCSLHITPSWSSLLNSVLYNALLILRNLTFLGKSISISCYLFKLHKYISMSTYLYILVLNLGKQ